MDIVSFVGSTFLLKEIGNYSKKSKTQTETTVSSTMPSRWNAKCRKALMNLFDNGLANPESNKADEIDPIKELAPEFQDIKIERFREHYRNCAIQWLMGKELNGARRCEFFA